MMPPQSNKWLEIRKLLEFIFINGFLIPILGMAFGATYAWGLVEGAPPRPLAGGLCAFFLLTLGAYAIKGLADKKKSQQELDTDMELRRQMIQIWKERE